MYFVSHKLALRFMWVCVGWGGVVCGTVVHVDRHNDGWGEGMCFLHG